jgi:hypothetical protein
MKSQATLSMLNTGQQLIIAIAASSRCCGAPPAA